MEPDKPLVNVLLGQQEIAFLLEAMGFATVVMWPVHYSSASPEQQPQAGENFLCFPGFLLVLGVGLYRCFLRMTN